VCLEAMNDRDASDATRRQEHQRQVLFASLGQRGLNEVIYAIVVHTLVTLVTGFFSGRVKNPAGEDVAGGLLLQPQDAIDP
jgi:hypothetical protein